MRSFWGVLSTTFMMGVLLVGTAWAEPYETAPVANGGVLSGKVSFKGAQPAPEKFEFAKFPQPKFCSQAGSDSKPGTGEGYRLRQDVKVNNGALEDVVVYITNVTKGKAFAAANTKLKAETCQFLMEGGPSKSVGVVLNAKDSGAKDPTIEVTNTDADPSDPKTVEGVLHNPHGYEIQGKVSSTLFNKPVPKKGQTLPIKVEKRWFKKDGSFVKIECDQHNYMNVWALPVSSPYYAIVNADGTFSIDQIPPGKYDVQAFHPKLGFQTAQIDVAAGGKVAANFEFKAQ